MQRSAGRCDRRVGHRDEIRDRINAHLKAGATHVCVLPIRSDNPLLPDMRAVEAFGPK